MSVDRKNSLNRRDFLKVAALALGTAALFPLSGCMPKEAGELITPGLLTLEDWKEFFAGCQIYPMTYIPTDGHVDVNNGMAGRHLEVLNRVWNDKTGEIKRTLIPGAVDNDEWPLAVSGGRLGKDRNESPVLWWMLVTRQESERKSLVLFPPAIKTELHPGGSCQVENSHPIILPEIGSLQETDGIRTETEVLLVRQTPPYWVERTMREGLIDGTEVTEISYQGVFSALKNTPYACDLSGGWNRLSRRTIGIPGDAGFLQVVGGSITDKKEGPPTEGGVMEMLEGEYESGVRYHHLPLLGRKESGMAFASILRMAVTNEYMPYALADTGHVLTAESSDSKGEEKECFWRRVIELWREFTEGFEISPEGSLGYLVAVRKNSKKTEWRLVVADSSNPRSLKTCAVAKGDIPDSGELNSQRKNGLPDSLRRQFPRGFKKGEEILAVHPLNLILVVHDRNSDQIYRAWPIDNGSTRLDKMTFLSRLFNLSGEGVLLAEPLGTIDKYFFLPKRDYSELDPSSLLPDDEFPLTNRCFSPIGGNTFEMLVKLFENPFMSGDENVARLQTGTNSDARLAATDTVAILPWGEIPVYTTTGISVGEKMGSLLAGDVIPLGKRSLLDLGEHFISISGAEDYGGAYISSPAEGGGHKGLVITKEDLEKSNAFLVTGQRLKALKGLLALRALIEGNINSPLMRYLPEGFNQRVSEKAELYLQTAARVLRAIQNVSRKRDEEQSDV